MLRIGSCQLWGRLMRILIIVLVLSLGACVASHKDYLDRHRMALSNFELLESDASSKIFIEDVKSTFLLSGDLSSHEKFEQALAITLNNGRRLAETLSGADFSLTVIMEEFDLSLGFKQSEANTTIRYTVVDQKNKVVVYDQRLTTNAVRTVEKMTGPKARAAGEQVYDAMKWGWFGSAVVPVHRSDLDDMRRKAANQVVRENFAMFAKEFLTRH